MDHALAKELKDAGFPQEHSMYGYFLCQTTGNEPHTVLGLRGRPPGGYFENEVLGWIAAPTLEELIEACGVDFCGVANTRPAHNRWRAWTWDSEGPEDDQWGETPLEAVARLWLTLNRSV